MKKIIIGSLLIGISSIGIAQSTATKAESEKWVLSKLSQYTSKNYRVFVNIGENPRSPLFGTGNYDVRKMTFYFEGQYLIASYEEVRNNSTTIYNVKIPVYNIGDVYCYEDQKLVFTTKEETMIENNVTESKNRVQNYFSIAFECKSETDLSARIKKALLHLKKFYKKPSTSEIF